MSRAAGSPRYVVAIVAGSGLTLGLFAGCGDADKRALEMGHARFADARRVYENEFNSKPPVAAASPAGATPSATDSPSSPLATPGATVQAPNRDSPVPLASAPAATPAASVTPTVAPPIRGLTTPALTSIPPVALSTPSRPRPEAGTQMAAQPPSQAGGSPTPDAAASPEPPGSDSEPPKLVSVEFSPAEAADGGDVRVSVRVTDNLSGVASGSGTLTAPSGKIFIPFGLSPDAATGLLAGTFKVPPESQAGIWPLTTLSLADKAQNTIVLRASDNAILAESRLVVRSSRTDSDPPVLESLQLHPEQVEDGGVVRITIRASDEKSAVASVRGVLANPSRTVQLNFYPRLDSKTGTFVGSTSIPKHSEYGEWIVTLVTLADAAGNRKSYMAEDKELSGARVTVTSSQSDTQPPRLVSLRLLQNRVQNGQALDVEVVVSDDVSGVKSVDGFARSPKGNARPRVLFIAGANPGEWTGSVQIPTNAAVGIWRLDRLNLSDISGNRTTLTEADPQLQGSTFEVY